MKKQQTAAEAAAPAPPPVAAVETTEVAVRQEAQAPATADAPIDFLADAGQGTNFGGGDLAIPFLQILQKNSPQVDPDNAGKYIDGAKVGMILNTVTNEVYDGKEGVVVIPTGYAKMFVEWIPRDAGGGFVGQHGPGSDAVKNAKPNPNKANKLVIGDHDLVETAYHYVLLITKAGGVQWAVISMTSTQLRSSRRWNTLIAGMTLENNGRKFKPASYAIRYRLRTEFNQKDKFTWYGWVSEAVGPVETNDVYQTAKNYYEAVAAGTIKVTAPPSDDEEGSGAGGEDDGEKPF